jgi:hypothetical protein
MVPRGFVARSVHAQGGLGKRVAMGQHGGVMSPDYFEQLCAAANAATDLALAESCYGVRAGAPGQAPWPTAPARVVFLDIDFVLNNERTLREHGTESVFDPASVAALNVLLESSGALLVISSAWRVRRTLRQLADVLETAGVLPGRVVGRTPWRDRERGLEIDEWLKGAPFPVASFVILDDMGDMAMHMDHLVQTGSEKGLELSHAQAALEVLSRSWKS